MTGNGTETHDELLTLNEVADLLKVTVKQVHELTRARSQVRGRHPLPCIKIHSKLIRVKRSAFLAWVDVMAGERRETTESANIKRRGQRMRKKTALEIVRELLKEEL